MDQRHTVTMDRIVIIRTAITLAIEKFSKLQRLNPLPPSRTHLTRMPSPKIVCPYTDLNEATELALAEYPTIFVDVSGSDEDYFWLLHQLWSEQETFVIVEHDIVPWPGALKLLVECPEDLCDYKAPISHFENGEIMYATGPMKFSEKIIKRYPNLWENSKEIDRYFANAYEWGYRRLGNPHTHTPEVQHLNAERASMHWNEYVQYRREHGPIKSRTGRKPSVATKEMQLGMLPTKPKVHGKAGKD